MSNDMLRAMSVQNWDSAFRQLRALMPSARRVDGEPNYLFVRQSPYGTIIVRFDTSSEIVNTYFELEGMERFTMDFSPTVEHD